MGNVTKPESVPDTLRRIANELEDTEALPSPMSTLDGANDPLVNEALHPFPGYDLRKHEYACRRHTERAQIHLAAAEFHRGCIFKLRADPNFNKQPKVRKPRKPKPKTKI